MALEQLERVRSDKLAHLSQQERMAVEEYLTRLRERYADQVARVVLFGSKARGDGDEESDIDLFVVLKTDDPRLKDEIWQMSYEIELKRGVTFGDLIVGHSRYAGMRRIEEPVFRNIRDEGIELWAPRRIPRKRRRAEEDKEMVDENTRIVIGLRLERCQEDLKFARLLLEQGGYRQAISRAYYAVFMIASAALLVFDIRRSKHRGVESAVHEYLVKPGLIEPEYGAIYGRALRHRMDANYEDRVTFTEEQASAILADCERFVTRLEAYLRTVGAIDGEKADDG
ncbi:MAG: HEPN domain-containing protein [Anaerolineae bacterium]